MSKTKLSVCGVIVYQSKFLIVKRSETDDFLSNCWEFPGGGVEDDESIENALVRELKEERYLQLNYKIVMDTEPQIILSSEHVAYDWVSKDDPRLDDFIKNIVKQLDTTI